MVEDARAKAAKQKAQWMKERELQQNLQDLRIQDTEPTRQPGQARQQTSSGLQPEVVSKLLSKMHDKFEENYKYMPAKKKNSQREIEMEESLHHQVMSNTCPVCFELFLPPTHQPFILFPCGHTFCKQCIETYAKQKKCCPFCRSKFNSMAPNISLQNLILSAAAKEDDYIQRLQQKREQMVQDDSLKKMHQSAPGFSEPEPAIDTDQCIHQYKMLSIKAKVMMEEQAEQNHQVQSISSEIRAKEQLLLKFQDEKKDCLDRLQKLKKELQLINDFEDSQNDQLLKLKDAREQGLQQIKFIKDAVLPVLQEQDKLKHLIAATAPSMLGHLNNY